MKMSLLPHLVCPQCKSKLYLDTSHLKNGEIYHGMLRCHENDHHYEIDGGVPNFVLNETSESQHQVADTYSQKWRMTPNYGYSEATLQFQRQWYLQKFGWNTVGKFKKYLWNKKLVLDAGCGLGRDVKFYAENTKGQVFGVDISDGIQAAQEKLWQLPNAHLIKADMTMMPFADNYFDFVACDQALHHTNNTHDGFIKLLNHVKRRGQIAIYVYKKKNEAREYADDLIRKYTTEMDYADCMVFATACTIFGNIVSNLNLELQRDIYWNLFKCFWRDKYDFKTNVLINLDWYHPKYAWRHTPEEVKSWYEKANVKIKYFDISESGISIRGNK